MKQWILVALFLALAPASDLLSQETSSDGTTCDVEVIVFRHLDQGGATPEDPVENPGRQPGMAIAETPGGQWLPLAAGELGLEGIAARLRQSSGRRLLYHGGWRQSLQSQRSAVPVPLPAEAGSAGLVGTLTVFRERFLHAQVDVTLGEGGESSRIRQSRRVRGSSPQYFDHPRFGLILSLRTSGPPLADQGTGGTPAGTD